MHVFGVRCFVYCPHKYIENAHHSHRNDVVRVLSIFSKYICGLSALVRKGKCYKTCSSDTKLGCFAHGHLLTLIHTSDAFHLARNRIMEDASFQKRARDF